VPDSTTFADALEVLHHRDLIDRVPHVIVELLRHGHAGVLPETPKAPHPDHLIRVVADEATAAEGARQAGLRRGLDAMVITTADILSLVFTPVADANGVGYDSFTFSVRDTDGPAFDPSPNTMTIDVTPINDAPVLTVTPISMSAQYSDPIATDQGIRCPPKLEHRGPSQRIPDVTTGRGLQSRRPRVVRGTPPHFVAEAAIEMPAQVIRPEL
jgi:hypothetical protein